MDEKYVDPVCGMELTAEEAADSVEYDGQTYYFCSQNCKDRFDQNPQQYVNQGARGAGSSS